MAAKELVFSGVQPTGNLHLGNYLGAIVNFVKLQNTHNCIYCVVDLHAITVWQDPAELTRNIREVTAAFIAAGIDPKKHIVFNQSQVSEHAELAWTLSCISRMGELERMTQFKDKTAKGQAANVGLFTYPMLMAADILIYDADKVPVGEDQRQHLEITRDLATRFNQRFGETLVVPEPHILKETAKIMELTDPTSKMSGSNSPEAGLVLLSDDPKRIVKKIKSAVTDAEREIRYDPEHKPGVSNLLVMESALTGVPIETLEQGYAGRGYGDLKGQVAEVTVAALQPFQVRMKELLDDPAELDRILASGAERAGAVSSATMARVKDRMGLLPPLR